jgi:hypothetical protein
VRYGEAYFAQRARIGLFVEDIGLLDRHVSNRITRGTHYGSDRVGRAFTTILVIGKDTGDNLGFGSLSTFCGINISLHEHTISSSIREIICASDRDMGLKEAATFKAATIVP